MDVDRRHTLSGCIFLYQDLQLLGCTKALNATSNYVGLPVDHNFLWEIGKVNEVYGPFSWRLLYSEKKFTFLVEIIFAFRVTYVGFQTF